MNVRHDLVQKLVQLRVRIESRNQLIRTLESCYAPGADLRELNRHQRDLADDYIAYGQVLKQIIDIYDTEEWGYAGVN